MRGGAVEVTGSVGAADGDDAGVEEEGADAPDVDETGGHAAVRRGPGELHGTPPNQRAAVARSCSSERRVGQS